MKEKMRTILSVLVWHLWMTSSVALAQTVVLSVPGPGALTYLPVYLAKAIEAGGEEGIVLKLRYFAGGPLALNDLNEHNADFAVVGLPAIAAARADGMPVVAIGQLSRSAMAVLLLRKALAARVHGVADLRGLRIGVNNSSSGNRSTSQMLVEYLLKRAGLTFKDVQIVAAGQSRETQRAALQAGTVDAVMADEPFAGELVAGGVAVVLADLYAPAESRERLGGTFIHAALATREDVLIRHSVTTDKVRALFGHVLSWMRAHSAADIAGKLSTQPGFADAGPSLLRLLQRTPDMFPASPEWDPEAIRTTEAFFQAVAGTSEERRLSFASFIFRTGSGIGPP